VPAARHGHGTDLYFATTDVVCCERGALPLQRRQISPEHKFEISNTSIGAAPLRERHKVPGPPST
jgi:hypothetical protein